MLKTWEVYKIASENPKAKFRLLTRGKLDSGKVFKLLKGFLVEDKNTGVGICIPEVDEDWELVREPVSWQEAIQEWIDGKDIYVEFGGKIYDSFKHPEDMSMLEISKSELQGGKWYIED